MKKIFYTCVTTFFTMAVSMASDYDIIKIPSENFNSRDETPIELIVAHCVGLPLEDTLKGFAYKDAERGGLGVAPHYLVPQITAQTFIDQFSDLYNLGGLVLNYPHKVPVIQFVEESERAYHAGVSTFGNFNKLPGCKIGLNSCSIGIEFHAPDYGKDQDWFKFIPFTADQMETGATLMKDVCERQKIDRRNIWGHSDISPWRATPNSPQIKTDPGPFFPWQELYIKHNLGVWPTSSFKLLKIGNLQDYVKERLTAIGYKMSEGSEWTELDRHVVNAFRMHFMQDSSIIIYPHDENFGKIDAGLLKFLEQDFEG